MRYERTGEYRSPEKGEYYECRSTGGPEIANVRSPCKNWILAAIENPKDHHRRENTNRVARQHLGVVLEEVFGELELGSIESGSRMEKVAHAALGFLQDEGVLPEVLQRYLPSKAK